MWTQHFFGQQFNNYISTSWKTTLQNESSRVFFIINIINTLPSLYWVQHTRCQMYYFPQWLHLIAPSPTLRLRLTVSVPMWQTVYTKCRSRYSPPTLHINLTCSAPFKPDARVRCNYAQAATFICKSQIYDILISYSRLLFLLLLNTSLDTWDI